MLFKSAIFLLAAASCVSANLVAAPAVLNTGASTQYRSQDNLGNYAFGYNEDHSTGGTFRQETGDSWGNKVGSYGLRDIDGRVRKVNYVADGLGFRASISSNEPGVAPQFHPAATINKPVLAAPLVAAPAVVAPVVAAPHYAAPVLAASHYAAPHYASHSIAGPVAYAPHLAAPGLLSAPVVSYGPALHHPYPIRR